MRRLWAIGAIFGLAICAESGAATAPPVCEQAWKSNPRTTEKLCRLEWGSGPKARGVEWVLLRKGCQQEGAESIDCAKSRECHPARKQEGDWGSGVILKSTESCAGANSKGEVPLLARDRSEGRVDLICDPSGKPLRVRLEGPGVSKECDFPARLK